MLHGLDLTDIVGATQRLGWTVMAPRHAGLSAHGTGIPVVLLHPLGVSQTFWRPVIALLFDHRVWTYDLPGHGANHVPEKPYSIHDLAEQLKNDLDDAGLERVSLAGMSLGGLIAQDFAANYSMRVDRLILIDTVATYPEPMRTMWGQRAQTVRLKGMESIVEETLTTWFTAKALKDDNSIIKATRQALRATDPDGYALACLALQRADTRELVLSILAPTLVICGDDDLLPFRAAAEWLAGTIKNCELAWLGPAKHAAPVEQSIAFAEELRRFLAPRPYR